MASSGTTVLVADDETLLRRLLRRVLEGAGYEVVAVPDGDAALEALDQDPERIAAVVLDVTMPPHRGAEMIEGILARRKMAGVVLTSGASLDRPLRALLTAHCGVFLQKPFVPGALLRAVETALERGGR